jgi:hypothetical protein
MYALRLSIFTTLLTLVGPALFGQDEAKDIFIRATDQLLTENMELVMDLNITDKKGRVKEKGFVVLAGTFGEVEKTKMVWLKPVAAEGTTVIFTDHPTETGLIEVYTPSNGKIRKLKATSENMEMVGSEAGISNITAQDPEELDFELMDMQDINGNSCYHIKVMAKDSDGDARGELLVEELTYRIVQITVFDKHGKKASFINLSDFQPVNGHARKVQPMRIVTENFETKKLTEMRVLKITSRSDLKEEDFVLPDEGSLSEM